MIAVKGSLTYGSRNVVVDIELEPARLTVLTGPNLAGKSLVLRCLYSKAEARVGRLGGGWRACRAMWARRSS